ncbi:carbon monoxide dehydrogenase [Rhodobacteraceae bacterium WD3A24]|nr:carbon monoxide dehydrogenase [Rhodobacteraceae bacterium WD3A24]
MLRMGFSQVRYEDEALVRGAGEYTDDVRVAGELSMVLVRSPAAAGRISRLDLTAARSMPGVAGVWSWADMAANGVGLIAPRQPLPGGGEMAVPPVTALADGAVRHVGEPVAVVVAETRAQAEDAAEAVELEVDAAPAVVDALGAAAPGAPRVWDDLADNRCFSVERGDGTAVARAQASAARIVRARLCISRVTAVTMEPRNALARVTPDGGYRLDLGTQSPHRLGADVAAVLGVAPERVRVVSHACGGSFGMKNAGNPEYVIALWAARRAGRPVRWRAGRMESFAADAHARAQWADAALALDGQGNFLALDVHIHAALGANPGPMTAHPAVANLGGLSGVYRTPAIHARVDGYFTNTQNMAPYRGAGRPEATYIIERMIDIAAAETGIDRVALRRRNMIPPAAMPHETGFLYTYDSGDFPAVMDTALAAADWDGFAGRRAESAGRGMLRGIGVVNPIEIAGGPAGKPGPEFARLTLTPGGRARMLLGSSDAGQGHLTAFRQVLADRLGLAPGDVDLVSGDTGIVPRGTGTFGSRTLMAAGSALWAAMDEAVERLRSTAAEMLEVAEADLTFAHGAYSVAGTDRRVSFADALARAGDEITAESDARAGDATFPNGCHVCEVEIDPQTGAVAVVRYTVADDVGTVVNPLLVKGQIAGGVAQGLGQALMEEVVYEPGSGQLLSASFMDYAIPRAGDLPMMRIQTHPVPAATNPLGVKGAGEAGTVGALAAGIAAIDDALRSAGAQAPDMPATPARIWQALNGASDVG